MSADITEIYSAARAEYYKGKRVGWDNWAEIEEGAHKYALSVVANHRAGPERYLFTGWLFKDAEGYVSAQCPNTELLPRGETEIYVLERPEPEAH